MKTLGFGKYADKTWEWIYNNDISYFKWLCTKCQKHHLKAQQEFTKLYLEKLSKYTRKGKIFRIYHNNDTLASFALMDNGDHIKLIDFNKKQEGDVVKYQVYPEETKNIFANYYKVPNIKQGWKYAKNKDVRIIKVEI